MKTEKVRVAVWVALGLALALSGLQACGGASPDSAPDAGWDSSTAADAAVQSTDGTDAGQLAGPDAAAVVYAGDGTPTRQACTSHFGSALSTTHGRLDGYLVAIVKPGGSGCNADSDHVHLQVKANGAVYDVAVTVRSNTSPSDVYEAERDFALPTEAWSEGWHASAPLDYVQLGMHASDFTATAETQLAQQIEGELAQVNHVSIYGTGYGPDGMHLVHRNSGRDGAIVIRPLSSAPHFLMFHFADQSF